MRAKKNLDACLGSRSFGPTKNGPNALNTYPIWTSKKQIGSAERALFNGAIFIKIRWVPKMLLAIQSIDLMRTHLTCTAFLHNVRLVVIYLALHRPPKLKMLRT